MNVTFLLGNGLDKAIGLKTGYHDFYKWYIEQPDDSEDIRKLKQTIKYSLDNGDDLWADFELALGNYTAEFSDAERFIKCFKSARQSLIEYLTQEYNAKITTSSKRDDIISGIAVGLGDFSQRFYEELKENEKLKIKKLLGNNPVHFIYISFNYTPTLKDENYDLKSYMSTVEKGNKKCIVDNYIKVHGLLENTPILGVNDISQIANEKFRTEQEIVDLMVKGESDRKIDQRWREKACQIINNSDVIGIFGMSVGDTDRFWWEQLMKWFSEDHNRQLIVYSKGKGTKEERKAEIRARFKKCMPEGCKRDVEDIIIDCNEKTMTRLIARINANVNICSSVHAELTCKKVSNELEK